MTLCTLVASVASVRMLHRWAPAPWTLVALIAIAIRPLTANGVRAMQPVPGRGDG